ncbi:MAG: SDR family oxidoreductase [Terracidiphilus sp.]
MSVDLTMLSADNDSAPQSRDQRSVVIDSFIVTPNDRLLITGAAGFIGSCVVESLLDLGFQNLVCFVRPSSDIALIGPGHFEPR